MVISLSTSGLKCQVGDFIMIAPPADSASAKTDKVSDEASLPKANLILKTRTELPLAFPLGANVIAAGGEYEVEGVKVKGFTLNKSGDSQSLRTVYLVELEGLRLAFLGELREEPAEEVLGKLGEVDILFLSADSQKLKSKEVAVLIKQIDPKVIVPLNNKTAKLLAEELGQKVRVEEKLTLKRKDLLSKEVANKLVWLRNPREAK